MSDTLKPCPFCGEKEDLAIIGAEERQDWIFVACDGCYGQGPEKKSRAEAIDAWNTRKEDGDDTDS